MVLICGMWPCLHPHFPRYSQACGRSGPDGGLAAAAAFGGYALDLECRSRRPEYEPLGKLRLAQSACVDRRAGTSQAVVEQRNDHQRYQLAAAVGRRGTTEQPWMHTSELASDELARAATESHSRWWK